MKERIISFIRSKGPVIPKDIAKNFGLDTTFAGAYLSELVASGAVKISHAKIGGSPVYYSPDQKEKLEILYKSLNEKDQRTYDLLKEKKVLRDKDQMPLVRVSLRNITDFAVPLEVNLPTGKELFWKWHLLSTEQAAAQIKSEFLPNAPDEKSDAASKDAPVPSVAGDKAGPSSSPGPGITSPAAASEFSSPKVSSGSALKGDKAPADTNNRENLQTPVFKEGNLKDNEAKMRPPSPVGKDAPKAGASLHQKPNASAAGASPISVGPLPASFPPRKKPDNKQPETPDDLSSINDDFILQVKAFFDEKNIQIVNFKQIRKNSEAEFRIMVPAVIGLIEYYCKAKNKKKCNDGDLSLAYIAGQNKKLPVLFLTTGDLTKKALNMVKNDFKYGMVAKKI